MGKALNSIKFGLLIFVIIFPYTIYAQEEISYISGMILSRGYDALTGEVRGDCMEYQPGVEPAISKAVDYTFELHEINDNSELVKHLNLSAAASLKATAASSVRGKAGFLRKRTINVYSVNLVTEVDVVKQWVYIKDAKLKDEFAEMARNNPEEFENRCGNKFIMGIQSGGEFIGLICVETESETEQENITAEVSGQYAIYEAEAEFSKEFQEKLVQNKTNINVYVRGGFAEKTLTCSLEGLINKAQGFPSEVGSSGGTPKTVILQSYSVLLNWPGGTIREDFETFLQELATKRWKLMSLLDAIRYIDQNPNQFPQHQYPEPLKQIKRKIEQDIYDINIAVNSCIESDGNNCESPDIPDPDSYYYKLPVRYSGKCEEKRWVHLPEVKVLPLIHTGGGDSEMNGNNPKIIISSNIEKDNIMGRESLYLDTEVWMQESIPDYSTFKGRSRIKVFDLNTDAPNCVFKNDSFDKHKGYLEDNGGKDNWNETEYYGTGLIYSAKCISDSKGNDKDKLGCTKIIYNPINVSLAHEEDYWAKRDAIETERIRQLKYRQEKSVKNDVKLSKKEKEISKIISEKSNLPIDKIMATEFRDFSKDIGTPRPLMLDLFVKPTKSTFNIK